MKIKKVTVEAEIKDGKCFYQVTLHDEDPLKLQAIRANIPANCPDCPESQYAQALADAALAIHSCILADFWKNHPHD